MEQRICLNDFIFRLKAGCRANVSMFMFAIVIQRLISKLFAPGRSICYLKLSTLNKSSYTKQIICLNVLSGDEGRLQGGR